ncbi:MAG TPA: tyrosine-type recombinase/integrase [Solirubrobacteraceae bacterium]|nr:tyrosine-type recombinase/integrase [Solirubrobacteraceae bacterium]
MNTSDGQAPLPGRSEPAGWPLRSLLNYAARVGYITANPCDALTRCERPKPGRAKTRYLSEAEIERILNRSSDQARAINALLIFSGVRASELLGLTWGDIDFQAHLIRVRYQMSAKASARRSRPKLAAAT